MDGRLNMGSNLFHMNEQLRKLNPISTAYIHSLLLLPAVLSVYTTVEDSLRTSLILQFVYQHCPNFSGTEFILILALGNEIKSTKSELLKLGMM